MIYDVTCAINRFELFVIPPFSWQILVAGNLGVVKNDRIRLVEVDSFNVPTGRSMIGVVNSVGNGDMVVNNNSDVYVFCLNVSQEIGAASIGLSFIIL